mgnify:CR=1 FL=1
MILSYTNVLDLDFQLIISEETESNNNGPIIAGSLGGAVLFIAGGLLLFKCIQVSTFASQA